MTPIAWLLLALNAVLAMLCFAATLALTAPNTRKGEKVNNDGKEKDGH